MRVVVQRVSGAMLYVEGRLISKIEKGLIVFLGVTHADTEKDADIVAKKVAHMRIFEDAQGKMNLSVSDVKGEVLLVSQFTLYGDCAHGNRPSFILAARPEPANRLYKLTAEKLSNYQIPVKLGIFGADMKIDQKNDGPVTILFDSRGV